MLLICERFEARALYNTTNTICTITFKALYESQFTRQHFIIPDLTGEYDVKG